MYSRSAAPPQETIGVGASRAMSTPSTAGDEPAEEPVGEAQAVKDNAARMAETWAWVICMLIVAFRQSRGGLARRPGKPITGNRTCFQNLDYQSRC